MNSAFFNDKITQQKEFKMTTKTAKLHNIDLGLIDPNPNNPRKTFNEADMKELSESIKSIGVLQPIVVRQTGDRYELVCGERRWRASILSEQETIPAIVRQLTDEESLDLAITENLQRKDVDPLEEATAFLQLIELRNYSIEMISDRFGKSVQYVAQRLKLVDLIESFRDLLNKEVIGVGHAIEISKLTTENQETLFEEEYSSWNEPYHDHLTVKQLKGKISDMFMINMADAPFDLTDMNLFPEMGACTDCRFNSSSNLHLFPDSPEKGCCTNRLCYDDKLNRFTRNEVVRLINEEPQVFILAHKFNLNDNDKKLIEELKSDGVIVRHKYTDFYEISEPDIPKVSDFDAEDESFETDFQEAMDEYTKELKEYEEIQTKGFYINGDDQGKIVKIQLKSDDEDDSNASRDINSLDYKVGLLNSKIADLKAKLKRNDEIAVEKTYTALVDVFKSNNYLSLKKSLTENEIVALYCGILSRYAEPPIRKALSLKNDGWLNDEQTVSAARKLHYLTPGSFTSSAVQDLLFREFIWKELNTIQFPSGLKMAELFIEIGRDLFPDNVSEIEKKQKEVTEKRKKSIDQNIKELKNQIKDLKLEETEVTAE